MPSETDMIFDWAKGTSFAVTVCDCEGFVIYANDRSKETFAKYGDLLEKNLKECHPPKAWETIERMIANGESNSYTISKNGVKKLIHQTPWYKIGKDGNGKTIGGLVEVSIVLPDEMPHFVRE